MQVITVKLNNTNTTIEQVTFTTQDGTPTIIKSKNKINYEFINNATGLGPEKILTKRVGNDLHVVFKQDEFDVDKDESDLIIEGFYDNADHALIGLNADGEYQYYIPDSGEVADFVAVLNHDDAEIQILGDDSFVAPWWVDVAEGSPLYGWLLGIAGLTAGILSVRTNKNNNGILDSTDKALADATDAVKAAEAAEQAAEEALTAAQADSIISQEEADKLAELNQAVNDAKDAAQEALNQVPNGTEGKDALTAREAAVQPVTIPAVTDKDNNGILDSTDKALADATDVVKAAEAAEEAAQAIVDNADTNNDGIISQAELEAIQKDLTDKNAEVKRLKGEADAAVKDLPAGATDAQSPANTKDSLQTRVDNVSPVDAPTVTDANNNGVDDTAEAAQVADALAKVKAAEAAEEAAQAIVDNADTNNDGIISQAELEAIQKDLTDKNAEVKRLKGEADAAVKDLPAGATDAQSPANTKDSLQTRVDNVSPVDAPTVTDANNNGVDDTAEAAQVADALAKVKAAEAAEEAAQAIVDNADTNNDGIISQAELEAIQKDLTDKNAEVKRLKGEADAAVKDLPAGATDAQSPANTKDSLQTRVDNVSPVDAPTVTDANNNGVDDTAEAAQVADALAKVKAAEAAEEAAQAIVDNADTNNDGIISQAELEAIQKDLTDKNAEVKRLKGEADAAVKDLPAGATDAQSPANTKDSLQTRVDNVSPVDAPTVTDANNNGVDDTAEAAQVADALAKVKAAEAAEEAAQAIVDNADTNNDGIISQAELEAIQKDLTDKNAEVKRLKGEADAAVKDLPAGATDAQSPANTKDSLQTRVDNVSPVDAPTVTDANNNGVDDTAEAAQVADALAKVKAAEAAEEAAQAIVDNADTNNDGIISQAELEAIQKDLTDKNAEVKRLKGEADAAVKDLPAGATDAQSPANTKDSLQTRVDNVSPVDAPTVTDANNNGVDDTAEAAQVADALAKVKAAEAAEEAAQAIVDNADTNNDGIISQAELEAIQKDLTDKNAEVKRLKGEADAAVKDLPAGATDAQSPANTKDSLQTRVDNVSPVDAPTVTDANNNGVDDTAEAAQVADALAKVKAAEAAEEAAQAIVDNADTNNDGIISQAELEAIQKDLTDKNAEVKRLKGEADAAVKDLPAGATDAQSPANTKDSLQTRVDNVSPVDAPTVTDANNNGVDDTAEAAQVADALAKVKAAEAAEEAAQAIVDNADTNNDGIISQAELEAIQKDLTDKNAEVKRLKGEADAAVKDLPAGATDAQSPANTKDSLQTRVDNVSPVDAPTVTDANNNGVDDTAEAAQVADALAKVKAAEAAEEAAQAIVDNADTNNDGIISQAELEAIQKDLTDKNAEVKRLKGEADAAVKDLPAGATDAQSPANTKDSLQTRVDNVSPVDAPTVTDANNNGVDDTAEAAQVADALAKVKAAEAAEEAAQAIVDNADTNNDGIISQAELEAIQKDLTDKNAEVKRLKGEADAAVKDLPAGATDAQSPANTKDSLQTRVDNVSPVDAPTVTDANNNGVDDTAEAAQVADALAKVKAAEAAEEAAQAIVDNADTNNDGIISQAELEAIQKDLTDKNAEVKRLKGEADAAVKDLPAGATDAQSPANTKDSLQTRVDNVSPVDAPTVTDANNNGVDDTAEAAQVADALAKVKAAEAAEEAAQAIVDNADTNNDGIISQAELEAIQKDLTDKNAEVKRLKGEADAAVKDLPAGATDAQSPANTKDSLQTRVDNVSPVDAPTVTDANNNGVDDTAEAAQVADALAKVKAAEAAEEAAQAIVDNADTNNDGIISQAELEAIQKDLTDKNAEVKRLKGEADAAVKDLPAGATDAQSPANTKDSLQTRVDNVSPVDAPTVTDANNNGVDDTAEAAQVADALAKVKAAEAAEEAAQAIVDNADTNNDGIISQAELEAIQKDLTDKNAEVKRLKGEADAAVKDLPAGATDAQSPANTKDSLQTRVDNVSPVDAPTVTDANNNGVDDTAEAAQVADALAKVKAAEAAEEAAQAIVDNADTNNDGIISQAELEAIQKDLTDKNAEVKRLKGEADAAVKDLPAGATDAQSPANTKDSLQTRVDNVSPVDAPTVTDANNNGVDDTAEAAQVADALAKVKAAEAAEEAAQAIVDNADTNNDGIISQAELEAIQKDLTDKNAEVKRLKGEADAAVKDLPAGATDAQSPANTKDSLQTRVDNVSPVDAPTVTDANNNGVDDTAEAAQVADALAKVKAAEAAEEAAQAIVDNADTNNDGIISQAELEAIQKDLTDKNAEVKRLKGEADAAVKDLPAGATDAQSPANTKDSLQTRVDNVSPVDAPTVTDANNNGVDDTAEAAQVADALAKVKAAEAAEEAAQAIVDNADTNNDGIISQAELEAIQKDLTDKNAEVKRLKGEADAAVKDLPAGATDAQSPANTKDSLQTRVDNVSPVDAPTVTDANNNGVDDTAEAAQVADALAKVKAAEAAEEAAQAIVDNADTNNDGIISQAELEAIQKDLTDKNAEVKRLKGEAGAAVKDLPAGATDAQSPANTKDSLQTRVDNVSPVDAPTVTDANNNGVDDTAEAAQVADALAKVKAAEAAEEAAQAIVDNADTNNDGIISQAELEAIQKDLTDKNAEVKRLKGEADAAVKDLPAGATDAQSPANTKDSLQTRVDNVSPVDAPTVTDANNNGVDDTAEAAQVADALAKVKAAEAAEEAAQAIVDNADTNNDGIISQAELEAIQKDLTDKNAEVKRLKGEADAAVKDLPAGATDAQSPANTKDSLQTRVDNVSPVDAPTVTDANNNGVDDTAEAAQVADALAKVKAAEAAEEAAQAIVDNADTNNDGIISQAELEAIQKDLTDKNAEVKRLKGEADAAVKDLPAGATDAQSPANTKDSLQTRVDNVSPVDAPTVTDANNNGVDDTAEAAQVADALAKVKAAEAAEEAAQAIVDNADTNNDGIISQAELEAIQKDLTDKNAEVKRLKGEADAAVKDLPAGATDAQSPANTKDSLQTRVDNVSPVDAPTVTDANNNGVDDTAEAAQVADALAKVKAAEAAEEAAQAIVDNADTNNDGIISQTELEAIQKDLTDKNAEVKRLKGEADAAVKDLPAGATDAQSPANTKDSLQTRVDNVSPVDAPTVTDANNNGVDDTAEAAQVADALAKVKAAEAAEEAAQAIVDNADTNNDGIISQAELEAIQKDLTDKNAEVKRLKGEADAAVKDLPAGATDAQSPANTKDSLQTRVDNVSPVDAPTVTDANNNGVDDTAEAAQVADALAKVKAAEAAEEAAQAIVDNADTNNDGIISQAELEAIQKDLTDKNAEVKRLKGEADAAVKDLPAGATDAQSPANTKDSLQTRVDNVSPVDAPTVTDANNNGVDDTAEAAQVADALAKVKAAEAAEEAAQAIVDNADTNNDGIISQAELEAIQKDLTDKNAEVKRLKGEADAAVKDLPAGATDAQSPANTKDSLQTRVDNVSPVDAPTVTDANNNGVDDTAEAAQVADALAKVKAAEAAEEAAQAIVDNADTNNDGIISQAELEAIQKDLTDKNAEVKRLKGEADAAVKDLPAGATDAQSPANTKDSLQTRVDNVSPVDAPTVTDANNNGVDDTAEAAQVADALAKVKAAEAAEEAAQAIVDNADTNNDGIISQAELEAIQKDLTDKNAEVKRLKGEADAAVKDLPAGATDAQSPANTKDSLQTRVDNVSPVDAPTVTDANNNGVDDTAEAAQVADALAKVKAAEAAEEAAQAIVDNADTNNDGIISQAELEAIQKDLTDKNAEVKRLKGEADAAVKDLPAGATDAQSPANTKDSLQTRVDNVSPVDAPTVTDANNNGVDDTAEAAQVADALAKVKAAEAAEEAAQAIVDNADTNNDGIISQAELEAIQKDLTDKNAEVKRLKGEADAAVKDLPAGATDAQSPANTKDSLQTRVDNVSPVDAPTVTDANNNGVDDTAEAAQVADALAKVKAAEAAEEAAQAIVDNADTNNDGIISQAELEAIQKDLTDKNAEVKRLKGEADAAVKDLPAGATDAQSPANTKDSLQTRVDNVSPVDAPTVTDANNNGVDDTAEAAQVADALAKVKAAEAAEEAAQAIVDNADTNNDGIISQAELEAIQKDLTDKNAEVKRLKGEADAAVKDLPAGATDAQSPANTKDSLQTRVDNVSPVDAPTVTDANNNGVDDTAEAAQVADALAKVKAAEAAEEAAQAIVDNADTNNDGIISQAELEAIQKDLTDKNAEVKRLKGEADAAVKDLPAGATDAQSPANTKDSLQTRVDNVSPVDAPTVTDANNNGILDTADKAIADLIKQAEEKAQEARDKLAELSEDGLITREDKAAVEAINVQLETLKTEILQKINELPDVDAKDDFTKQVNQISPVQVALSVFITQYKDDYGDLVGSFGSNTSTDDNTLTFMGEGEAGETLYFYMKGIDGDLVNMGSTAITATGTWEFTPTWLTNREHTVYASYLTPKQVAGETKLDNPFTVTVQGPTAPPQDIGAKSQIWSTSTAGDVNGDGFDDLVSLSWSGNYGDVMLGGAQISAKLDNITTSKVWHQAGVGDVNGDGYNDILYATARDNGGGQIVFGDAVLGQSNIRSASATLSNGPNNGVASAGDVNGDGLTDMLALGTTSSSLYYGKQDMSGAQTAAVTGLAFGQSSAGTIATWGAQQYAAGIGDFNGDGYGDVVTATGIYFGSATGLSNANSIKFNHAVTSANAAGDVNGDGYADAVIVDGVNRAAYVVYGGKAAAGSTITLGTATTSAVNLSIVGANGGFAIGSTLKGYQTTEYSVAAGLGDINGDGLSDILITTYGNNTADNQKNTTGIAGRANYAAADSYIVYGSAVGKTIDTSTLANSTDGLVMPESQADGSSATGMTDVNGDGLADVYINSYSTPGKLYLGGAGLGAEPSVKLDSAGTINGTTRSNFLVGSAGDDVLIGNGGADVIYAGAGNDKIVLNHDNLSMLSLGLQTANSDGSQINNGDGRLARVDGGSGVNTLSFDSTVVEVNLTNISNAGKGFIETSVGMSRIANIQQLDLTQTNAELTLSLTDVMDMNAGVNAFAFHTIRGQDDIAPGLDLTPELYDNTDLVVTPVSRHQLLIQGDAGDTVNITKASEWIQTPAMTVTKGGESYHVYNSVGANQGQLLIDTDMLVNFII